MEELKLIQEHSVGRDDPGAPPNTTEVLPDAAGRVVPPYTSETQDPPEAMEKPEPGALSPARLEQLLAYCKLTELADDPEVAALIPVLYGAAVGYMDNAGVSLPEEGTPRRAQYDLCVNYLVLDGYERRETAMVATVVSDNPAFRRLMNQLKLTEPEVEL